MWDLHYIFGFSLAVFFVLRIILNFADRAFMPFDEFQKGHNKEKIKRILYSIHYLLVAGMIITGLLVYFREDIGLSKDLTGSLKEIHELMMYFFAFFIPVHIIGVFVGENLDEQGIVSNMIGGHKKK
jgi:cytochrome b561